MKTRRPARTSRLRAGLGRLAVLLALLSAAAGLAAYLSGASAAPSAPTTMGSASGAPVDDGREVFLRDCAWCHGQDGTGTQSGPPLTDSGAAAADFYLRTGRMPLQQPDDRVESGPPAYSDRTIDDLVGYVATLGSGPEVPALRAGDPVVGRTLFLSNCAACHSSSGTGMVLTGGEWAPELFDTPPTQVAEAVRVGPGAMPRFTDEQLEQEQVDDIVSYVDQLGDKQVIGGAGLDQFGPIAEGLFVWLVLVPLLFVVVRLLGKRARR